MKRHERLPRLLSRLSKGRHTAANLALGVGVCVRTIYRDMTILEGLGYRIRAAAGRSGGFELHPDSQPAPLHLDTPSIVALAVSAATHEAQGTLPRHQAQALLQSMRHVLPFQARQGLETLIQQLRVAPSRPSPKPRAQYRPTNPVEHSLAVVHRSLSKRRGLILRIQQPTRKVLACYLEPETLSLIHGRWHLKGWDSRFNRTRTTPLDAILDIRVGTRPLNAYRNQIPHPTTPVVRPGMLPANLRTLLY